MFFVFFCRLNSRYLTEEQKGEMTRERKRCIFHLITYSVHVLVDSTWMWVSPQECWSYIGRYSWAHGTGGAIDKSSAVTAVDLAWVIPCTLTVYKESPSMSSHGIKKVSDWLLSSTKVANSVPLLVGTWVKLFWGVLTGRGLTESKHIVTPQVMNIVLFLFESIHTEPRRGLSFLCFRFDKENFEQEIN